MHLMINRIHFKVYGAYPPKGVVVSNKTMIHLEEDERENNNNKKKLQKFHDRSISKIKLIPTMASYQTTKLYGKHTKDKTKAKPSNQQQQQQQRQYQLDKKVEQDVDSMFESHISPFLKIKEQIAYMHRTTPNENKEEEFEEEEKKGILEFKESAKSRHFVEGETFIFKGVEFQVMACEPKDGYIDIQNTRVFCQGLPVSDLKKVAIRPIAATLAPDYMQLNVTQMKERYIDQFFKGRSRIINNDFREFIVNGITFVVFFDSNDNDHKQGGIVTRQTLITGFDHPMSELELRKKQEKDDMALAKRLQAETDRREEAEQQQRRITFQPVLVIQGPNGSIVTNMSSLRQQQQGGGSERGVRLAGPPMTREQLALMMLQFAQHSERASEARRALPQTIVDQLPTWEHDDSQKNSLKKTDNDDINDNDGKTCRICLMTYENGEVVKALPCLHIYHKECIDKWFTMNRKCPICKMDVSTQRVT